MENVLWRKEWKEKLRGVPQRLSIRVGAVDVEVDRPALPVAAVLPPVLQRIASFKMSTAFLWLSRGRVCAISRL